MDMDKANLLLETLEDAAESEAHDPCDGNPELLLDAKEMIEELLDLVESLNKTRIEMNAEIQALRSAGVVF